MNADDAPKPLDDLLSPGSTLMVGFGESATEFRPLTVAKTESGRVEILLDTSEAWAKQLKNGDRAVATLSDSRTNTWVSMTGTATLTTDPKAIDALWNPAAAAYFDNGRDTPGITVLRIDGDDGRYWTAPSGRIGSLISMVKAKLGSPEDSGESGDLAL